MTAVVDEYLSKVVQLGDEGSELLAKICAPTLKNSEHVDILEHMAVLRIPDGNNVVVHSAGGNPEENDLAAHSRSLVDRLVEQAKAIGAKPIAFADVVDSSTGDKLMLETIAHALVQQANKYGLAIMNGENAILGVRVNCDANVSGTMVSILSNSKSTHTPPSSFHMAGVNYAIFDPEGKAVFINSDGIGTKTAFYERAGIYHPSLGDSLAMKVDDTAKAGAIVKAVSDVVETKGNIPFNRIMEHAAQLAKGMGILYILQQEEVGNRLQGYNKDAPAYNISGSVVSVIDEERLRNPLKPNAGDYIVAIRGKPNPRSNGITDKRKKMVDLFGQDWHKTEVGQIFLKYLAEPSTVLYPVFKELIDEGLATSVYHMSGGAYNGKFARPLAQHDLFVSLDNLFPPDWRELTLAGASFTSAEVAYAKWPMGNDGFIATRDPAQATKIIEKHGLETREVGQLERARVHEETGEKITGVELAGIKASNGKNVYYSGK